MSKFGIVLVILMLVCVGAASSQKPTPSPAGEYRAVIDQYCAGCHNPDDKVAGLDLSQIDLSNTAENAETLEKIVLKLRSGMMPPPSAPHPTQAARDGMVSWLETSLDKAGAAMSNPGRPLLRRLNRAEYANAIRDLLALDVDASNLLPPDDSGYGFDNNADVLGVSPVLLERYLAAAGKISALAMGDPSIGPAGETFRIRQDASQDRHIEGLPLGTIGGMLAHTTLPLDGQYLIQVKYFRTNLGAMRGLEYPHQIEITVDGARVHLGSFGGDEDFKAALENITLAADSAEARSEVRVPLNAGPHDIGVAFLQEPGENTVRLQPFIRSSNDTLDPTGHAHIDRFTVTGPFDPTGPGDTPSRRRILLCQPAATATPLEEETCAKKILNTLVHRAYRGLDSKEDSGRLLEFYKKGRSEGSFESGIQMALQRLLASPKFVFRAERDPQKVAPGTVYRVGDKELASRLSFFLWSSIPDDELLAVANAGKLSNPAILEQQVKRMLADQRSSALVDNFAGQWLYLRNLKNQVPNSLEFPDFDDNLRVAMQRETELFFQSIMREDRNVVDLMTADYTYVNERLAKHYGIPNVYGSQFRRVTLTSDTRRGLLGKGSILMVTSHTDRTSPVVRGKWILENLLGAPVPPPPANVPPLKETADRPGGKVLTMRERLAEHRTDPACSSCHSIMDPLGFALENFDAVGAYRTREARIPIDATGQLLDGTRVDGVDSLRKALLKNPEMFVQTFTEKLMTYSLGRGISYYDMPAVRAIVRDAATKDNRFSAIVMGIVKSTPFQMRTAATG
jgi:hypothetical protein